MWMTGVAMLPLRRVEAGAAMQAGAGNPCIYVDAFGADIDTGAGNPEGSANPSSAEVDLYARKNLDSPAESPTHRFDGLFF